MLYGRETVNSNCSLILQKINMYINFDNKENNFRTRMWIAFIFVLGLVAAITACYSHCVDTEVFAHQLRTQDISNHFILPLALAQREYTPSNLAIFCKLYVKVGCLQGSPIVNIALLLCSSLH